MNRVYRNAAVIEWHYIDMEGVPKLPGLYLVASIRTRHRVFTAKFTPSMGWHTATKGRYIYAWANNPAFPPYEPQIT